MAYYRTCPLCGSNNDPGEACDCRETKKEVAPLHRERPRANAYPQSVYQPLCAKSRGEGGATVAEELRELRLSKQIPAKDMVAVVQAIYPKYDKTVQSKCENGDAYGVSLRPDAMAALYSHFAPELAESRKTAKKDAHRLTCRISARLETADYEALQRLIEAEGYATTQDWLTATVRRYITEAGETE